MKNHSSVKGRCLIQFNSGTRDMKSPKYYDKKRNKREVNKIRKEYGV